MSLVSLRLAQQNVTQQARIDHAMRTGDALDVRPLSADFWANVTFGCTYYDDKFTLLSGDIQWGTKAAVTMADKEFTISEHLSYVGIEFEYDEDEITGKNFGTSKPASNGTHFRKWFWLVGLANSLCYPITPGHFNIELPGVPGEGP